MLKVAEHYTSVQGEGPRTGIPTQFVRFGGCNLRCPGWPCDSLYAVEPKYRKEWQSAESEQVLEQIHREKSDKGATNICFTGGEPFIQQGSAFEELVRSCWEYGYLMEVFTNGTILFPDWATSPDLRIMMDWKLPGSGEANKWKDVRDQNAAKLHHSDGIKFVISNMHDLQVAAVVTEELTALDCKAELWAGVAWGTMDEQSLVEHILQLTLPWRLNVQVHKYVWPDVERGI